MYDADSYIDLFCSTSIFRYVTPYFATDLCHGGAPHQSYSVETETETSDERWGAGVETQKNIRGEVGGWGRVPFNEPYALSLSTIYEGA